MVLLTEDRNGSGGKSWDGGIGWLGGAKGLHRKQLNCGLRTAEFPRVALISTEISVFFRSFELLGILRSRLNLLTT